MSKFIHNYHELTTMGKIQYWFFKRWILPKENRLFYEGCISLPGQMYIKDRKALYDSILLFKPRHCFEIGTYTGGGSTFFLSTAFKKLGRGKLITSESNASLYNSAKQFYQSKLKQLSSFIEFVYGEDLNIFLPYIKNAGNQVDCVFFDGSDNPQQTVEQYLFFSQYMSINSIFMAHDWNDKKMELLRPRIEQDNQWELISYIGEPESVGFVVYRKKQ